MIHSLALVTAANRAATAVDRAVTRLWRELLAALRTATSPHDVYQSATVVLRRLGTVVQDELQSRLLALYYRGHQTAATALRRPVMEAVADWGDLLVEPPEEDTVLSWLTRFVRPWDWNVIGTDNDKRMPESLAAQLAAGYALGQDLRELAKGVLPFVDGSRVRATRVARTFGLHVAHQGQWDSWQGLGDLVVGFQIHATLDQNTRPEHRKRDGTIYYKHPEPGQKGFGEMPRPPLEADGRVAFNCRCFLLPVLRQSD